MTKVSYLCTFVLAFVMAMGAQGAPYVVYEHLPEANSPNVSFHTVGGPVLADDFDPAIGGDLSRAEWWGSRATSSGWEITFHFGQLVAGRGVPAPIPPLTGGVKIFVNAVGADPDLDGIFYYTALIPSGTFPVSAGPRPFGQEYWFSVANANSGWTWAYGGAGPTVGDEHWDGVVSGGSTPCGDGGPHCGAWSQINGRDFAFRLSAVPEPGTFLLLGSALVAVGLWRRRK